jgi:RNA polymerase sigma-70 factor, ECF subfamily
MTPDPLAPLIAAVAAEDRAAFRALYQASAAKLMGVSLRILKDRQEAEDAVQEVFTRVWLKARGFDATRGSGLGWLVTLMRNHAIDRLRARVPQAADAAALEVLADAAPRAEARLVAKGEARRIGDCIDGLEPARAQAVRGAYLDGLSYDDLARRHAVPLNTMRTWLRRSLMALRECMET